MKVKGTILAAATATLVAGLWQRNRRSAHRAKQDQKLMDDALQTFEGEGGLIAS